MSMTNFGWDALYTALKTAVTALEVDDPATAIQRLDAASDALYNLRSAYLDKSWEEHQLTLPDLAQ
jgi:hypothetical protein